MTTYTITITGVFEADSREEALDEFIDWLRMGDVVENGAIVVEEES